MTKRAKGQWIDAHGTKHMKVFVPTVDAQVAAMRRYSELLAAGVPEADAMRIATTETQSLKA